MEELWMPNKVLPDVRKDEGGSYFDDEMDDTEVKRKELMYMAAELINHVNERPDHVVYVASHEERTKMRTVFNFWKEHGLINTWPTIKIDYGVPDGTIRVDEDR